MTTVPVEAHSTGLAPRCSTFAPTSEVHKKNKEADMGAGWRVADEPQPSQACVNGHTCFKMEAAAC